VTDTEIHRVLTAIDLAISVFRSKPKLTADQRRICHELAALRRGLHSHQFSPKAAAPAKAKV
jgi:hypothetical protein